jgi:hypothetical protein
MLKKTLVFLLPFAIAYSIIYLIGYFENEKYIGQTSFESGYSVQEIWDVLEDVENRDEYLTKIDRVDFLGSYLNLKAWEEDLSFGGYRKYIQIYKKEKERYVVHMKESNYGMSGFWDIQLIDKGKRTEVIIKEQSTNTSIIRRGFQYFLGRDSESKEWIKLINSGLFKNLLTKP